MPSLASSILGPGEASDGGPLPHFPGWREGRKAGGKAQVQVPEAWGHCLQTGQAPGLCTWGPAVTWGLLTHS